MGRRGILAYFCRLRDCDGCGIEAFWPCGKPWTAWLWHWRALQPRSAALSVAARGLPGRGPKLAWDAAVGSCRWRLPLDVAVGAAVQPSRERPACVPSPRSEPVFRACDPNLPFGPAFLTFLQGLPQPSASAVCLSRLPSAICPEASGQSLNRVWAGFEQRCRPACVLWLGLPAWRRWPLARTARGRTASQTMLKRGMSA